MRATRQRFVVLWWCEKSDSGRSAERGPTNYLLCAENDGWDKRREDNRCKQSDGCTLKREEEEEVVLTNRTVVGNAVVGRLLGLHKRLPIVAAVGVESLAEEGKDHYRHERRQ